MAPLTLNTKVAEPVSSIGSPTSEPFPSVEGDPTSAYSTDNNQSISPTAQQPNTPTIQSRIRSASKKFEESSPPAGFMLASAQIGSSIPTLADIRRGSYTSDGWSAEGQVIEKERRLSLVRRLSGQAGADLASNSASPTITIPSRPLGGVKETETEHMPPLGVINSGVEVPAPNDSLIAAQDHAVTADATKAPDSSEKRLSNDASITPTASALKGGDQYRTTPFDNGYQFPPKRKWTQSTLIFLKAFWHFFITPIGFLVTIYGLNVVAWGGMLFLLLCNASPAMCKPTCNDIGSPRRIWIEIDSQILNALFCVTGFGTIPWRFRDFYYLMQYRIQKKQIGLRRLAGINRGWFRLAGSQDLPPTFGPAEAESVARDGGIPEDSLPFPLSRTPDAPLTGIRAPPTATWKLDFVIWSMVWNTLLQGCLAGFMWGYNRIQRPSWSTGLFVALACIVAGCGGIMSFIEGKKVKGIEGVPLTEDDRAILQRDRELGITHYNNIKDAPPKEKKAKSEGHSRHRKQATDQTELEEASSR